jgi:hypothetical protein
MEGWMSRRGEAGFGGVFEVLRTIVRCLVAIAPKKGCSVVAIFDGKGENQVSVSKNSEF